MPIKFQASWYVKVFQEAQRGATDNIIAEKLGLTLQEFEKVIRSKETLREALQQGREEYQKKTGMGENLSVRHQNFVDEYLIDLNATAAALRAGYSEKCCGAMGWHLLRKAAIQAAIQKGAKERAEGAKVDAEWVLSRLMSIADANVQDCFDKKGRKKAIPQLPRRLAYALKTIKSTARIKEDGLREELMEITMTDKLRALDMLGRYLSMFEDKVSVSHKGIDLSDIISGLNRTNVIRDDTIEEEADRDD